MNCTRMGKAVTPNIQQTGPRSHYQAGIVTTFTGVLILVLLTLMMFFAMRVGVFEQRVSSNDMRQKLAFHAAESGVNHAKEFFRANARLIANAEVDFLPNGTDGWLADTSEKRWQKCSEAGIDLTSNGSHPCYGESIVGERANEYYYSFNGSTELPLNTDAILPNGSDTVVVEALLCVLEVDPEAPIPVQGCSTDPDVANGDYFMLTLLSRGMLECGDPDNPDTCTAESLVSEQVSNFSAAGGGYPPNVPLTTKSSFPPSGTAEVVPNPNAGGVGVPISVWMDGNSACSADGTIIDPSSGSWATCEMHEWYGQDVMPDDYACPGNCTCLKDESISYTQNNEDILGIDLVQDPLFPCDLFQFYFGVPRANYELVKGYAEIINDCSSLGPNSFGMYWATGTECRINSNTQVGSPDAPVILISAATTTRMNGGAKFYGTLFVTDVEKPAAALYSNGTNTVYGSVVVDATLGSYQGTFQVVWNESTASNAPKDAGLGAVLGGWSDFHRDWE